MQALKHYEKASLQGHAKATTKLGNLYYSGIQKKSQDLAFGSSIDYDLEPDRDLALKKYIRAGRRGDSEAYNCAGLVIEATNPIDAVEFYKKAIALDQNNTNAMFNMALLYYNKKEEAEWHSEAIELMTRAALKGNIKAREYLEGNQLCDRVAAKDELLVMGVSQPSERQTSQAVEDDLISYNLTQSQLNFSQSKISDTTFELTKTQGSLLGLTQVSKTLRNH